MEAWQSPVYCSSLENCRVRNGAVSSNLTASANIALVMELVYVLDSKSRFCGFESRWGHQVLG